MDEKTKISVIVPLYNTEKHIGRCLDSLTAQTYGRIEIIVVDDGSTDGSAEIAERYAERDSRIRVIKKERNEGLYHARITGVEAATGSYIGFVDSDDTVSIDFYRAMLRAALDADGADITMGLTVEENERGERYIHNIYHGYRPSAKTHGELRRIYWQQEGACFVFHTVWNKIYRASLWKKALPVLKKQTKHLVMCEDFVFSSCLFALADTMAFCEYAHYYYLKHSAAATSLEGGVAKFEKSIRDMITAFGFVEELSEALCECEASEHLERWRELYAHFWRENVVRGRLGPAERRKMMLLLDNLSKKRDTGIHTPSYFYSATTPFDDRYEKMIEAIVSDSCEAVSFDIFDTALCRPFYRPEDLFLLLDEDLKNICPSCETKFSKLRIRAERALRARTEGGEREEITLEEIYREIACVIGEEAADLMMKKELEAEMRYAEARRSVLNLWRLAHHLGKKIYFTSDMYLSSDTLGKMLEKCGYKPENILVSRDTGLTKRTGRLFHALIKKAGVAPSALVHIGDDYSSDVTRAQGCGIQAYHLPRAVDCIEYNIPSVKSTHTANCYTEPSRSIINFQGGLSFLGVRTALAIAANKLYDNPFISYNEHSEMNASPQYFGYYALGMHLLGFVTWLTESAIEIGYDTLLFIARDGYLPMRAYETVRKYYPDAPVCSYMRTSRKATLPLEVKTPDELLAYVEKLNAAAMTPRALTRILGSVLDTERISSSLSDGICFGSASAMLKYANERLAPAFSKEKAEAARRLARDYLDGAVTPRSAVVDVGYSARLQEIIFRETGKSSDAFYVHINDGEVISRERSCGFDVRAFYGFTPSISGAVRELLFSRLEGSTVGYETDGEEIRPVTEKAKFSAAERYLIEEIQRTALEFTEDFTRIFGDKLSVMHTRGIDVSLPFEYFVHTLGEVDSRMFECVIFEDDLWSGGSFSLADRWLEAVAYHGIPPHYKARDTDVNSSGEKRLYEAYHALGMEHRSVVSKLLFWLVADRRILFKKIRAKMFGDKANED